MQPTVDAGSSKPLPLKVLALSAFIKRLQNELPYSMVKVKWQSAVQSIQLKATFQVFYECVFFLLEKRALAKNALRGGPELPTYGCLEMENSESCGFVFF